MKTRPYCFNSRPSPQAQAENDCVTCPQVKECLGLKSESEVQQLIMLEAANQRCILMRNNSGGCKDATGRMIFYGLGNVSKQHNDRIKSSDLIGIWKGRFVAIEVKREGWVYKGDEREVAQKAFIDWIIMNGGIAGFCSSVQDFHRLFFGL